MNAAVAAPERSQRRSVGRQQGSWRDSNADDEASGVAGSLTGLCDGGCGRAGDAPACRWPTQRVCRRCSRRARRSPMRCRSMTTARRRSSDDIYTLTATAGGRTVFTLVVNADGSWTFDLDDQLDHVDDGANDENFALLTSAGDAVGVARSTSRRSSWRPTRTATRSR